MMLDSREACVNYSMPLGLHHIFSADDHYGPGAWWAPKNMRKDWTPPYYHQADANGIGFDRTAKGSNSVSLYHEPLSTQYSDPKTCPEEYLLWFHHLSWNYKTKNGKTLWDELCYRYDKGVKEARGFQMTWDRVEPYTDNERFVHVQKLLRRQSFDALVWKDATLLYFQQFNRQPIPYDLERPVFNLDFVMKVKPLDIYSK